jgi:hypothetical protein
VLVPPEVRLDRAEIRGESILLFASEHLIWEHDDMMAEKGVPNQVLKMRRQRTGEIKAGYRSTGGRRKHGADPSGIRSIASRSVGVEADAGIGR